MINRNNMTFLAMATADLISHGFEVRFVPHKFVRFMDHEAKLGGFFCEDPKSLSVATGVSFKRWFQIFLHEYNHFKQYIDGEHTLVIANKKNSYQKFDQMISGEKIFLQTNVNSFCKDVQNMELNCEIRSVEMIDKYDLDVDKDFYIKRANAYVYLYTLMRKTRKWPDAILPYNIPEIWEIMPNHFLKSYEKMPTEYYKLCLERCYKK